MIGSPEQFAFLLQWKDAIGDTSADTTTGRIQLTVGGLDVWGPEGGPEVELVDLLEFLSANWNAIVLEQTFPTGLDVESPSQLLEFATISPLSPPAGAIAMRQTSAFEFFENHDLSRAFSGFYFPWVVLLRQGAMLWVCSERTEITVPLAEAVKTLSDLAEEIRTRLQRVPIDNRGQQAIEAWNRRRQMRQPLESIQYATGLDERYLNELPPRGKSLVSFLEAEDAYRESEPLAAARMIGPEIAPALAQKLISTLKSFHKTPAPSVDNLARRLNAELQLSNSMTAYEQGYQMADWFRTTLRLSGFIDVRSILYGWNVRVRYIPLEPSSIDAIACWGANHGPGIVVNKNGRRSRYKTGMRSSLAHEICHLLIDRNNMLPAAEILGGRMPTRLEQRAEAFAAELLLPREEAKKGLARASSIDGALFNLSTRFSVSRHLTALQIINSGTPLTSRERALLDRAARIVPYGHRF